MSDTPGNNDPVNEDDQFDDGLDDDNVDDAADDDAADDDAAVEDDAPAEESSDDADLAASGDDLESQLDGVAKLLASRARKMMTSNIVLVVIGVIMAIAVSVSFTFIYGEIKHLEDPAEVVSSARGLLDAAGAPTSLDDALAFVEAEIEANAPVVAAEISKRALTWAPEIRKHIQTYAVDEMTLLVDQGTSFTAAQFEKMVDENRETIESALRDLADNEKLSKDTLDSLIGVLEDEIGTDLRAQVAAVLSTVHDLNTKLAKLSVGVGLNEEEQAEREFVMIARRILADEADPANKDGDRANQQPLRIEAADEPAAEPDGEEGAADPDGDEGADDPDGDEGADE